MSRSQGNLRQEPNSLDKALVISREVQIFLGGCDCGIGKLRSPSTALDEGNDLLPFPSSGQFA